ncbi:MAG: OsmC family protein [Caldiserica bacterium]|nr:OsmC family protein [Caldisericota bacterium]
MEVRARYREGISFELEIRGHRVVTDLPPDKGGKDAGPSPPELLVAALASCAGVFAALFARRNGLSPEGIEVEARARTAGTPMRLEDFAVRVRIPGLPPELEGKARAFVEACLVGQTLRRENHIALEISA